MNAALQCLLRAPPFKRQLHIGKFDEGSLMLAEKKLLHELLRNQILNVTTEPRAHYQQLKSMTEYVPNFSTLKLMYTFISASQHVQNSCAVP